MKDKVALAKQWANNIKDEVSESTAKFNEDTLAAGEVLRSLDSRWVEASKVREISAEMKSDLAYLDEDEADDEFSRGFELATMKWLRELRKITPSPPTLADMSPEERRECKWMQAKDDVGNHVIITELDEENQEGKVLYENGNQFSWYYEILVPLPHLPRMEWPGGDK